jgi:hypothetical protein
MSILANAISTAIPVDGKLNLLSGKALEENLQAIAGPVSLDFGVAEGTEVELVFDPEEAQPYRLQVNGTTEEAYTDRTEAERAFKDALIGIAEANREAKYQEDDRRAGR